MISLLILPQLFACKGCNDNNLSDQGKLQEEEIVFTNSWGKWLDMAKTSNGSPVLSYYDITQGGLGVATGSLDGSEVTWSHESVDGFPNEQGLDQGDRGLYSSIAVDASDRIWVSYYDVGLKNLRYATKSNGSEEWTTGVADTGSGGTPDAGFYSSIALDSEGLPVIAHYDNFRKSLRVAHYDGASFSAEIVDEGEDYDNGAEVIDADVGKYASIAIESGVEYIAYYDAAAGDLKLAWGSAGDYSIEVVDSEGNVGQWPSIVVQNGAVYISYHDISNDQLKFTSGRPAAWTFDIIDQGEAIGADSDILVSENGIFVTYHDGYNNDMKYAYRNSDGTWNTQSYIGVDGALGFHNALVEIDGTLYGASFDYTQETVWFSSIQ